MGFFSVSSTICLVLLAVATTAKDIRARRDAVSDVQSVSAFIRKCTADELSKGCTEAPNAFGPDKTSCICVVGRARRDTVTTVVKSVSVSIRKCTADESSKGCTEAPNEFGPDKTSCTCNSGRARRDTVTTVVKSVSGFIRKCTADELSKGCTEAPNAFGPDKTSCICVVGRVRRDSDLDRVKRNVFERECTHEEMVDKHCTLVADIGQPLRCDCPE
ncbi:unnamed protein product, partial [Mesorhabditis belari]|uniref:Uncharacterized protein n=1 Tax=Mesorhabditis belari TaxID=2138241 RepID=A0AAF3F8X6_9BILA